MMIERMAHTQLGERTWEVPTGVEGEQFFLRVLHMSAHVIVVQAMCTFVSENRKCGDYACYIGAPPAGSSYDRAARVAERGHKLNLAEGLKYGAQPLAPNGVHLVWRA